MKKIIAVLLLLAMMLGLCACGGESSSAKSNEIQLTLDNYDDYIEIYASAWPSGDYETDKTYWFGAYYNGYHLVKDDFATHLEGTVTATPTSENFVFNNVKVTVRFTGKVPMFSLSTDPDDPDVTYFNFSFEDTFSINAGGKSKDERVTCPAPSGKILLPTGGNDAGMYKDTFTDQYEIIAISGTITPA